MARRKRTIKSYLDLFRNPKALFPSDPAHNNGQHGLGASVTLWPNGDSEIWIQGSGAKGFRITASEGPSGLALQISSFVGSPPISISGNKAGDYECFAGIDARHISLCQYNGDDQSQAFKKWYNSDAATRGNPPERQ